MNIREAIEAMLAGVYVYDVNWYPDAYICFTGTRFVDETGTNVDLNELDAEGVFEVGGVDDRHY